MRATPWWLACSLVFGSVAVFAEPADEAAHVPSKREAVITSTLTSIKQRLGLSGKLFQETAYRVGQPREFTKTRNGVLLTERGHLTDALSYRATQRAYYDPVYAATDNFSSPAKHSQQLVGEIRETYLDYSNGAFDVRLGKQQIVWGDAVGLFFADVVNAKDLREYVLPDFDLIRIPQWALDVEASGGNAHGEFVWLPVRAFHRLGVSGSEFVFPLPVPEGRPSSYTDPSKPPASFSNSEVGGRVGYLLDGWDVSAFYLYTWDKFPVLFRTINGGVYTFAPEYRRANLLGMSFSKDLEDVVLKGEFVVNPHAFFSTFDTQDPDGVVHRPVVDYLLGVDRSFGTIEANVQLMQRVIGNFEGFLANEEALRTHLSMRLKTTVLDGKLEPEFLLIAGIGKEDLLYRPRLTWKATDSLQVRVGADVFQGKPSGLFGRFNDNSRLYTEVAYFF